MTWVLARITVQLYFITSFVENCISEDLIIRNVYFELFQTPSSKHPHGFLSLSLTPSDIASENKEVEALLKTTSGSYETWSIQ